LNERAQKR